MKKNLILIFIFISGVIFLHHFNAHTILRTEKKSVTLKKEINSLKTENCDLIMANNNLIDRKRIEKLAKDQLAMILPKHNNEYLHYIKKDKKNYSLTDYFIPSLDAIHD